MDFGKAFSFPFQDSDWLKKVGIAGLVFLIPVVGQIIVMGWALEITRRVINDSPDPLPDWSDFGGYLSKGFMSFVVSFAYMIPVLLLSGCMQVTNVGGSLLAANVDSNLLSGVISVTTICLSCLVSLISIAISFILPAAIARLADTGELSAAFKFNEVIALVRAAPAPYLLVMLGALLSGIAASFGLIACFIGVIFTMAYAITINSHLSGQAYKIAKAGKLSTTSM
ncbi:MAG: DUF4013 domain-containing protein [Chloroflexota bacterium]